jgi:hypothetical protein
MGESAGRLLHRTQASNLDQEPPWPYPLPTPWYRPPPFVNNIRGWDGIYLNSPGPSPSNQLDLDLDFVAHPNSHDPNHLTLVFSPEIVSHRAGSPSFLLQVGRH